MRNPARASRCDSINSSVARVSRRLREERGQALVLVLIVVSAMTISTAALMTLLTSNEKSTGRDRQVIRATNIGQAALNYGVSYMQGYLTTNDADGAKPVGSTVGTAATPMYTGPVDGGTMSWYAVKDAPASWTIYAHAVSPGGAVARNFSLKMGGTASPQTTTTTASPVYGYGYVMADPNADCASVTPPTNGGDTIGNSAAITIPMFIASSLCVSAGAPAIGEPAVEPLGVTQSVSLYVGKTFRTENSASPVGTSAKPIKVANIVYGCQAYFKKNWTNQFCNTPGVATNGTGSGVFASFYQAQQQSLTKPTVDLGTYSSALPGPAHTCNGGSTMGLFKLDNDTNRNTSLQIPAGIGWINLLHLKNTNQGDAGNNFDCRWVDPGGNLIGQLKWVDGNPGALTVKGTIFIDGNLNFSNNDKAVYSGTGVIYVDGTITGSAGARLCAGSMVSGECPTTWDTTTNNLELVAINHQNMPNAISLVGDAQLQGILFANGNFESKNGANIYGTVIADSGQLSGNAKFASPPQPPVGAPGAPVTTTTNTYTWIVPKGGWSQY